VSASEAAIVARALVDPRQFAPLYMAYIDPVHRYCYRRLGTREQAEDATSLVFERALRALPTWRGGSFRAWLFAIAYHVVMDDYRQRRPNLPYDPEDETEDPAPGPEEIAIVADEQRLLLALLPQLSPDQRSVMELRLSGLQAVEVAQILGRTPESVRTLQRRAVDRLQVMLGIPAQTKDQRNA
jgi:RNA polymerase sigma-70 factor (ECF subfamily)